MSGIVCRVCRAVRPSPDALIDHMTDHSPRVLAEELVKALDRAAVADRRASMAERCGKLPYNTEQAAMNALLSTWQADDPRRREVRAYQCHKCGGRWHLTSQPLSEAS